VLDVVTEREDGFPACYRVGAYHLWDVRGFVGDGLGSLRGARR
jgi:hypothetical protein